MKVIEIYTDGSTRANGQENATGAWAFIALENGLLVDEHSNIVYDTTNQRCELLAAIKALGCHNCPETIRIVHSDSAYLINCIKQEWWKKWQTNGWVNAKKQPVANKDLWEKLIPYFQDPYIQWVKVEGHATNHWNNYVDNMAQEVSAGGTPCFPL